MLAVMRPHAALRQSPALDPITASLIAATVSDSIPDGAAVCRLARLGAAARRALPAEEDAPWPDHQNGQSGDPQVAGVGGYLDGLPGRRMEQRGRRLAARIAWAVMTRQRGLPPEGVAAVAQATA